MAIGNYLIQDDEERANEQEQAEMYAEYLFEKERGKQVDAQNLEDEQFEKWIYANKRINNGNDLVLVLENTAFYEQFLRDTKG
ncbi:hypothetical protein PIGBHMHK_00612 [Mycoplasmopsis arginini]|uniref:hypothetical protein n=1 Tax=Mycoplasmopsis arginini TaxID=2094 RepID=UPI00249E9AA5|nr:hypothetical protein [Mycoplasmopsis arginini]MDI3348972.1 hypothetical protein [Mycoplasmopsis arginini]